MDEIDDTLLSGLSEKDLNELSELIDPDNQLLPPSERLPPQTTKKPTGPYDKQKLNDHLKKAAEMSTVGENYIPFIKKPAPPPPEVPIFATKKVAPKTEFDDMLQFLDENDLAELASELGLHGVIDQAQSRGDVPVAAHSRTGLRDTTDYDGATPRSYKGGEEETTTDINVDEIIASVLADNPSVTEVNLNNVSKLANTRLKDSHALALAQLLTTNTTMLSLNLESNRIGREGIKARFYALLCDLKFKYNLSMALSKALASNNTTLRELRLVNQYQGAGAGAEMDFAKCLEKNNTIIKLGYSFTYPAARVLVDKYLTRNLDFERQKRASVYV
ncbi:hypothetical protein EMCRGX_G027923 [Ephydatia muelleri]